MNWSPGRPVSTEADRCAWEAWRLESKRAGQRERRRRLCRIDWEASPEMRAYLAGLQERHGWPPIGTLLAAIVIDWAQRHERGKAHLDL